MKLKNIFFFLLLLPSCASQSYRQSSFQYQDLEKIAVGISTEAEFIEVFGQPSTRSESHGYYTLNYVDPRTHMQRLSANFVSSDQKLWGFLWIPSEGETEFNLANAKNLFKKAKFTKIFDENSNPHAISDSVSVKDEALGITIRYHDLKKTVEAIAIHDVTYRLPATTDGIKFRYTFGDEKTKEVSR